MIVKQFAVSFIHWNCSVGRIVQVNYFILTILTADFIE